MPSPGDLFYAKTTVVSISEIGSGDLTIAVKNIDRSYCDKVLRCLAVDDRVVIAEIAWSQFDSPPHKRMLPRQDYKFDPVGPTVVAELGIAVSLTSPPDQSPLS